MSIENMTMKELRDLAEERGIDIKGLRKKDDIISAISQAEKIENEEPDTVVVDAEIVEDATPTQELSVSFRPGVISANFTDLKAYVSGILAEYDGWEPSADDENDVKQCAAHRKYLNGLAKQIDEKRKSYKSEYMRPLTAFEAECNGVRDQIKEVSSRLNDVEKDADESRKSRKTEELREHYETYAGILADVVPYERIADPKWLNKQPTTIVAKQELEDRIDAVSRDWKTLKRLNLEFYTQAEIQFFETLDLGAATAYADKLAEDARKIEAMKDEIEQYNEPETEVAVPAEIYDDGTTVTCDEDGSAPVPLRTEPLSPIPIPVSQPIESSVCAHGDISEQIVAILRTYPVSKQENVLEALRAAQRPSSTPVKPYVMILDGATVEQLRAVGKLCGLVGVAGTFKQGTVEQVFIRLRQGMLAYGA